MRTTTPSKPAPANLTTEENPTQAEDASRSRGRPTSERKAGELPIIHRRKRSASMPPGIQHFNTSKRVHPTNEPPFLVATFDSSNGGLIASKNIMAALDNIFGPDEFRLVPILDHDNAPYGKATRDEIIEYVTDGLTVADKAKFDAVLMACNTACTAFKNSPVDKQGIKLEDDFKVKVHDLIANTANDVAANGGKKPVILSTEATARDPMYESRIRAASNELLKQDEAELQKKYPAGKELTAQEQQAKARLEQKIEDRKDLQVVRIGAGNSKNEPNQDWASLINGLKHLSKNPEHQAQLREEIAKYVNAKTIPPDATSIYLCCTHYPVFKADIEAQLTEIGRGHVKVIDPMQVQVRSLIKQYWDTKTFAEDESGKITMTSKLDLSNRRPTTKPIVVTSGKRQRVKESIDKLFDSRPADVQYRQNFGNLHTGTELKKKLYFTDGSRLSSSSSDTSSDSDTNLMDRRKLKAELKKVPPPHETLPGRARKRSF